MNRYNLVEIASCLENIPYPGLALGSPAIKPLGRSIMRYTAVYSRRRSSECLWIVFLGGTGTGKSTLFNAFIEINISRTGVERPKTRGPVAYAPNGCAVAENFPFPEITITPVLPGEKEKPISGRPGQLQVLGHDRKDLSRLILVDTPDLDSVEEENRRLAGDFYLLADAVVFVASQEKYADEVPFRFLLNLLREGKPCFFLLNKADEKTRVQDILDPIAGHGLSINPDRIWLIPYFSQMGPASLLENDSFRSFRSSFSKAFAGNRIDEIRKRSLAGFEDRLKREVKQLITIVEQEKKAAGEWARQLNSISDEIRRDFVDDQRKRFAKQSQESLGREIRKLFSRYDILAGPRRFIQGVITFPIRLLGLTRPRRREDLARVRQKIDLAPVKEALAGLNRRILDKLSPQDESAPLYRAMRRPGILVHQEEMEALILTEEKKIEDWLQETFERLSRELPAGKRWGIYSTSIVWGILILSFETAVGGGFTVLDAAIDSALAPFVTKGAVELFAAREIRIIARDLSNRYREALLSVLRLQQQRYEQGMKTLTIPEDVPENLRLLQKSIG